MNHHVTFGVPHSTAVVAIGHRQFLQWALESARVRNDVDALRELSEDLRKLDEWMMSLVA